MKPPLKTMETNQKTWKTMKPPLKTLETNQKPWKTMKPPLKTMETNQKPWKTKKWWFFGQTDTHHNIYIVITIIMINQNFCLVWGAWHHHLEEEKPKQGNNWLRHRPHRAGRIGQQVSFQIVKNSHLWKILPSLVVHELVKYNHVKARTALSSNETSSVLQGDWNRRKGRWKWWETLRQE